MVKVATVDGTITFEYIQAALLPKNEIFKSSIFNSIFSFVVPNSLVRPKTAVKSEW